ncbi:unnamed protein product [Lactuca saligna]|uniref:Uncharacterized protein n=1 Tax=Lactuca saligna TaxID=75948 RepID=A0AA35XZS4_LACSI|nr:unnamed protein product [Lactuca saligna]
MDHGKAIINGGVSVEGTSGLLLHEKLKAELELFDSEDSLEPTTPLSLSECDEEDEDVESEVEPEEDPEEEPPEDPDEEPEEDREEEPKGNHVEYCMKQRYETFDIPYVEYTPTSPGTYWERLYKDEMPQAQLEIHSLKINIEEIDEHRSRLEVLELRKPTITKLWEGYVARAKQAKAATYGFLDKVVGGEPPQNEVLVIQSGPGYRKAKKIRKSGRFTRVTPEDECIPIRAYVRALGDVPETPLNPNATHGSSGSHRGRGRGHGRGHSANTITREELADEIARAIRDTLLDVAA